MAYINPEAINQSINELGNEVILLHNLSESIGLETDEVTQNTCRKKAFAKIRYVTEKDRPLTEQGFRPTLDIVIEFTTSEKVTFEDEVTWDLNIYKIKQQLGVLPVGGSSTRNRFVARLERKKSA